MSAWPGLELMQGRVPPEWLDVNDHMNVAYYVLAFDLALDSVWARLGIDDESIARTGGTTFAVETHVTYQAELRRDDPYLITGEILAYDAKRVHQLHRMYHVGRGILAATAEWMTLHVDLDTRRVAKWPAAALEALDALAAEQGVKAAATAPAELCGRIRVPSPRYSLYAGASE